MNFSRVSSSVALAAGATLLVTTLAACGSDSGSAASSTSSSSASAPADPFSVTETQTPTETPAPAAASTCPTAAPANGGTPEWTLPGATGSVAVTGSTDATAPNIKVDKPFSVKETQVHTLQAGEGPVVADTATVSVCYMGVNGRDGSVFDSSYERGAPEEFPLTGVVAGFQKAIAGQRVGSTVAVAMTSADGYADGQPAAGILPGDTLVFAIKILNATS
ncbi:FKBP-type peptidyl-prolyl cis-trans isomerase [Mycobacterium sp. 2YAF39]|uniref:FKBP-type peptidyl-prolyl cis-trans isomerase n=1 Tax=Mycobacterium sp. 2YAF39 TaxID=3233033 RepID=UPI003F9B72A4